MNCRNSVPAYKKMSSSVRSRKGALNKRPIETPESKDFKPPNHFKPDRNSIMSFYRKLLLRLYPYKTIHDDYIARMQGSIGGAGMLHDGNTYLFDYIIQRMPATGAVLEIGSFAGLSSNVIAWFLRKYERKNPFFACDPWVYDGYYDQIRQDDPVYMACFEGCRHIEREAYTEFIRESFVRNTQFFSAGYEPQALRLSSDVFFENWKQMQAKTDVFGRLALLGGPLSFVYVDGDHSYEQARRDIEHSLAYLEPGGFLLLDDSADFWRYGSVQLAREMRSWKGLELVMKNPNYLYRKC